jgi:glycosyltransferase involved in cell wall biosynthesis
MLRQDRRIHFLFIGSGSKKPWLEREAEVRGLTNVTVLGPRPRSESLEFLNACDVSIMALRAGMEGAGVPSRLYNVLAAGKPVIAAMDASSEVGRVVREDEVGWVVPTSSARAVCEAVREASSRRDELLSRSKRAREVAERKYSFERILERWVALLREV